jgi:ABC-2 type transport system ATP-binding protein
MARDPTAAPAIAVDDLQVVRGGRPVLKGVTVAVPRGEVAGLLGPSGCGKSTLMRAIMGVQVVASGGVRVLDEAAGSAGLRHRVGYVTQAPSVYGDLTVAENLRFFASVLGCEADRIGAAVAAVGLDGYESRLVGALSGGQRSRVSLATAMLGEPEVLVLDEPTVGLDPVLRQELWTTFHELAAGGATLLVSSHVMEEAAQCTSLILMREGEVLAQTTPDALRADTGEQDLSAAFLAIIERASR